MAARRWLRPELSHPVGYYRRMTSRPGPERPRQFAERSTLHHSSPSVPLISTARPLDIHRPRAMRSRAIAQLAIAVVAPAERLAGHRRPAGVRAECANA